MTRDRDPETSAHPPRGTPKSGLDISVRRGDAVSPLTVIRERERALESAIDAAHESAKSRIAQARVHAAEIKETAEREGVEQARTLYDQALSRAAEEAESIRRAGAAEASALLQSARPRISTAVEEIMRFVLPSRTTEAQKTAADR